MKLIAILVIVCLAGLTWLVVGGHLSCEATGLALGATVGALLTTPVLLVRRAAPQVIYQERIVYRIAESVEPPPERATSTALATYRPQIAQPATTMEVRP